IGATSASRRTLEDLVALLKSRGKPVSAANRARLADCAIAVQVLRFMGYHIAAEQEKTGVAPTLPAQMAKLFASELNQRITTVSVQALGMDAQAHPSASTLDRWAYSFLRAVANTIEGGTSEIQRNVIATRGLGLPRG
ncbi:MAG TPA: acyl-CoA dehydrogenase family protein, partial [Dehalococcoidia bacterium]|nr:acyl-CoA dehydrogenase family protein [Dehalococcoidia bacterium]